MLHIKKVLGAKPKEHVVSELKPLFTPWGKALDVQHVLEEHPTPQFARASFQTLNGLWDCTFANSGHAPTDELATVVSQAPVPQPDQFTQQITVPFSPEAPLSGIERQLQPTELLWYRRTFDPPARKSGERVLLHFQAVDYVCSVWVNGELVGVHEGGYIPFAFDITEKLADWNEGNRANELLVCVADPSEFGGHLRGKQRFDRGDIWYTAQSGIWQTVWLEIVPAVFIKSAAIKPDARSGVLSVSAIVNDPAYSGKFEVTVADQEGVRVAAASGEVADGAGAVTVHIPNMRTWSPSDPHLYTLELTCENDRVASYCGFRTVEMKHDENNVKRVFLNGKPLFLKGVLDQAYWSDGLMTAPADEALVFDIEAMRDAGFNLMRKHIKVEAERWYYHCDRLGMLVLQDMVSGGAPEIQTWHWSYKPTLFKMSWNHFRDNKSENQEKLGAGDHRYQSEWLNACRETVQLLSNHPCIIGWSLFNEGWGQFDARKADRLVRALDPTRVVDAVSGWYDQGCGDFSSVHNYFRDMDVWHDRRHDRAFFISEFGGFTHRVDGHSSLDEAYGYEPYDDVGEWRNAVRALIAEVEALEPKGLVGYVYTQVSDIEEETSGILTYDRRVNKLESQ